MGRVLVTFCIAILPLLLWSEEPATTFSDEQVQRAITIAELRYGPAGIDETEQRRRLAELLPPSDQHYYRVILTNSELRKLLEDDPPWSLLHRLGRDYDLERSLADPEIQAILRTRADRALTRSDRVRALLLVAAGQAQTGDLAAAWQVAVEAAEVLPPGWELAYLHQRLCREDWRYGQQAAFRDLLSRPLKFRAPFEPLPQPDLDDEDPCPLIAGRELAQRVAISYQLPARTTRLDNHDAIERWLQDNEEVIQQLSDPVERSLLRAQALTVCAERDATGTNDYCRGPALALRDAADMLESDLDGPLVAAFAAQATAKNGLYSDSAELALRALRGGQASYYMVGDALQYLHFYRPDLALDVLRQLAAELDPEEVPCWVQGALKEYETDPAVADAWRLRLALGQCRPVLEVWNRSVEAARKELIKRFAEAGDTRAAFVIYSLHHYRSFCGTGANEAVHEVLLGLARLQVAAGLDERGVAAGFLDADRQRLPNR
jgi:hypothetical protein